MCLIELGGRCQVKILVYQRILKFAPQSKVSVVILFAWFGLSHTHTHSEWPQAGYFPSMSTFSKLEPGFEPDVPKCLQFQLPIHLPLKKQSGFHCSASWVLTPEQTPSSPPRHTPTPQMHRLIPTPILASHPTIRPGTQLISKKTRV